MASKASPQAYEAIVNGDEEDVEEVEQEETMHIVNDGAVNGTEPEPADKETDNLEIPLQETVGTFDVPRSGTRSGIPSAREMMKAISTTNEEVFELPRDILVAYFIIKISEDGKQGRLWDQYDFKAKVGIYAALVLTFALSL